MKGTVSNLWAQTLTVRIRFTNCEHIWDVFKTNFPCDPKSDSYSCTCFLIKCHCSICTDEKKTQMWINCKCPKVEVTASSERIDSWPRQDIVLFVMNVSLIFQHFSQHRCDPFQIRSSGRCPPSILRQALDLLGLNGHRVSPSHPAYLVGRLHGPEI